MGNSISPETRQKLDRLDNQVKAYQMLLQGNCQYGEEWNDRVMACVPKCSTDRMYNRALLLATSRLNEDLIYSLKTDQQLSPDVINHVIYIVATVLRQNLIESSSQKDEIDDILRARLLLSPPQKNRLSMSAMSKEVPLTADLADKVVRDLRTQVQLQPVIPCTEGKIFSDRYNRCIPVCKATEVYDDIKDECITQLSPAIIETIVEQKPLSPLQQKQVAAVVSQRISQEQLPAKQADIVKKKLTTDIIEQPLQPRPVLPQDLLAALKQGTTLKKSALPPKVEAAKPQPQVTLAPIPQTPISQAPISQTPQKPILPPNLLAGIRSGIDLRKTEPKTVAKPEAKTEPQTPASRLPEQITGGTTPQGPAALMAQIRAAATEQKLKSATERQLPPKPAAPLTGAAALLAQVRQGVALKASAACKDNEKYDSKLRKCVPKETEPPKPIAQLSIGDALRQTMQERRTAIAVEQDEEWD